MTGVIYRVGELDSFGHKAIHRSSPGPNSIHILNQERQDQAVACHSECPCQALPAFFNWLYREGHTEEHILDKLKPPRVPNKIIEPLTDIKLSMIYSAMNPDSDWGSRDIAIITVFLDTGLRRSELADI